MEIDYKNKKRILIGIIIVLVLINITALGTLGYEKYKRNHGREHFSQQPYQKFEKREDRIKQYVKKELNLTDKQCTLYFHSMDQNFAQSKLMLEKIGKCKQEIVKQIINTNPDTLEIYRLCDSIGFYHTKMQRGMNRHFLYVMNNLDTAQKAKLGKMLIELNQKNWEKNDSREHDK